MTSTISPWVPARRPALHYDRFEIVPAPGGAELVHTARPRSFGVLGRIVSPFSARFAGRDMPYAAHRIDIEIADRNRAAATAPIDHEAPTDP